MVLDLQIVTFGILNSLRMVFINLFLKYKSCMSTSCVNCLLCVLSWVSPHMGDQHIDDFLLAHPSMD